MCVLVNWCLTRCSEHPDVRVYFSLVILCESLFPPRVVVVRIYFSLLYFVGVYFTLGFTLRLGFISILLCMPLMCISMKSFLLAYFVAIKGEKNGISILSECPCMCYSAFISQIFLLCLCLYCCCCCICFATISGLCRCCHGCCNILLLLMMIWEFVLSTLYCTCSLQLLYRRLEHVCVTS